LDFLSKYPYRRFLELFFQQHTREREKLKKAINNRRRNIQHIRDKRKKIWNLSQQQTTER